MGQRLIRYRTEPEQAGANARLAEAVYAEPRRTSPAGVSYTTFRAMIRWRSCTWSRCGRS